MATIKADVSKSRCKRVIPCDPSLLDSYADNVLEAKKYLRIKLVPFRSYYDVTQGYHDGYNLNYYLRFYIPKAAKKKSLKDLFIMFNGLGDAGSLVYDDLGLEFAKRGLASVLVPLPCHYHRRNDFNCRDNDIFSAIDRDESRACTQSIVSEIARSPSVLIHMYRHILRDAFNFLNTISGDKETNPYVHSFFDEWFVKSTRLHLLGYSLGGLVALALILRYPNEFHSCYLVESGASFEQINAGILFERKSHVVRSVWQRRILPHLCSSDGKIEDVQHLLVCQYDSEKIKDDYKKLVKKLKKLKNPESMDFPESMFVRRQIEAESIWTSVVKDMIRIYGNEHKTLMPPEEADIFEKIVLGDHKIIYKDDLAEKCTRILIILGGSDVIFQMDAIMSFAPRETGLAILQIPKLGHWLKFSHRDVWSTWKGFIVRTILEFADTAHVPT
jgi:pimeloyl-ACP methyl ester carboxylesterase